MDLDEESIWSGASLRPWQILHAKLAEMNTSGDRDVDVWKFVDEAMKSTDFRREELIWPNYGRGVIYLEEEPGQMSNILMANSTGSSCSCSCYELMDSAEAEEEIISTYHTANSAAPLNSASLHSNTVCGRAGSPAGAYHKINSVEAAAEEEEEEEEILCAVCLETLLPQILFITRLPCGHSFHSPCISPWLCASSVCPCCRAPFAAEDGHAPTNIPPDLEASPDLAFIPDYAPTFTMCSHEHAQHNDLMNIFAEMETALHRFGLLFT